MFEDSAYILYTGHIPISLLLIIRWKFMKIKDESKNAELLNGKDCIMEEQQ